MSRNRPPRDALRFIRGNNLVFALTDLLGNFARGMVMPYTSLYILALGGDTTQIGLVNSIRPLAGLVMFPIGGYIADHARRVRLVVLGSCLSAAIVLMYTLAPSWEVLAMAALLQGFVVFQLPARSALIADSLLPEDRGQGIAAQNAISWCLTIFAPYIGGVVVESYGSEAGPRALYWVVLLVYVLVAIIQVRFLRETTAHAGNGKRLTLPDLGGVLRDAYGTVPSLLRQLPRSLRALAVAVILSHVATSVLGPFWVLYAMDCIEISLPEWGVILLVELVLQSAMFVPAGMLVDRWGRTVSALTALSISLACTLLFVFAQSFTAVLLIRRAQRGLYRCSSSDGRLPCRGLSVRLESDFSLALCRDCHSAFHQLDCALCA
ncbi:MAG: MFS transporter [Anaerolineae bacterium]|jgi:MFS family permease